MPLMLCTVTPWWCLIVVVASPTESYRQTWPSLPEQLSALCRNYVSHISFPHQTINSLKELWLFISVHSKHNTTFGILQTYFKYWLNWNKVFEKYKKTSHTMGFIHIYVCPNTTFHKWLLTVILNKWELNWVKSQSKIPFLCNYSCIPTRLFSPGPGTDLNQCL